MSNDRLVRRAAAARKAWASRKRAAARRAADRDLQPSHLTRRAGAAGAADCPSAAPATPLTTGDAKC
jgi:hypothetical protein